MTVAGGTASVVCRGPAQIRSDIVSGWVHGGAGKGKRTLPLTGSISQVLRYATITTSLRTDRGPSVGSISVSDAFAVAVSVDVSKRRTTLSQPSPSAQSRSPSVAAPLKHTWFRKAPPYVEMVTTSSRASVHAR